jgi:hypothetical protein
MYTHTCFSSLCGHLRMSSFSKSSDLMLLCMGFFIMSIIFRTFCIYKFIHENVLTSDIKIVKYIL